MTGADAYGIEGVHFFWLGLSASYQDWECRNKIRPVHDGLLCDRGPAASPLFPWGRCH